MAEFPKHPISTADALPDAASADETCPDETSPDETFVARVMGGIAAAERRRALILSCLTALAAGLMVALGFGVKLALVAWADIAGQLPSPWAAAVQIPTIGLLVLGVSLLVLLVRDPGVHAAR